jgi:hypothetical protein
MLQGLLEKDQGYPRTDSPTVALPPTSIPRIPTNMLNNINSTIAELSVPSIPTKQFPQSGMYSSQEFSIVTDHQVDIHMIPKRITSADIDFVYSAASRQVSLVGHTASTDA